MKLQLKVFSGSWWATGERKTNGKNQEVNVRALYHLTRTTVCSHSLLQAPKTCRASWGFDKSVRENGVSLIFRWISTLWEGLSSCLRSFFFFFFLYRRCDGKMWKVKTRQTLTMYFIYHKSIKFPPKILWICSIDSCWLMMNWDTS